MSIIRFIKNWTLPISMVTGATAYSVFAFIPSLDKAACLFASFSDITLPLFMFLILSVIFCKVNFRRLISVKWHLQVSLFQMLFVFAIIAIILFFRLKGNDLILMEAPLMYTVGPYVSAAAVITQKLGGDFEEMTTYTFLSNFITASLVPICFPLIEKTSDIVFMGVFLKMSSQVCLVLVVPMGLAYVIKHYFRRFHRWVVGAKDLSHYLWGCSLMIVMGITMKNIAHAGMSVHFLLLIALLGLLLCVIQFSVGRFIGHYFNVTVNAGQALGRKNATLAIWIAYSYLNPISPVSPGCYTLWQNVINGAEI